MASTRTLLVDDSPKFLAAAGRFLAGEGRLEVVGQARSGDEALTLVARLRPSLVLMDWSLPGMSGLEATRRLKGVPGAPCIVMLTQHEGPLYRAAARAAGADGFVAKADMGERLLPLLRTLLAWPE